MSEWRVAEVQGGPWCGGWFVYVDESGDHSVNCYDDEALARRIAKLADLEAIVAKVPKMADGVVIMPDQDVWLRTDDGFVSGVVLSITWGNYFIECLVRDGYGKQDTRDSEDCYSTLEAAHAAEEEENHE